MSAKSNGRNGLRRCFLDSCVDELACEASPIPGDAFQTRCLNRTLCNAKLLKSTIKKDGGSPHQSKPGMQSIRTKRNYNARTPLTILALSLGIVVAHGLPAQELERKEVLVLHGLQSDMPIVSDWNRGILATIEARIDEPVRIEMTTNAKQHDAHRWKVERTFAWLKNLRRLTTRWEYHPHLHEAFWQLGCLYTILKQFQDRFYRLRAGGCSESLLIDFPDHYTTTEPAQGVSR